MSGKDCGDYRKKLNTPACSELGVDRVNLRNMYHICGGDFNDKMHLLMEYAGRPDQEVADPWYTDDFDTTWRDVLEGCQGLLDDLLEKGERPRADELKRVSRYH